MICMNQNNVVAKTTVVSSAAEDEPKVVMGNTKLGTSIPTVNQPPIITCRKNCPCAHLCYARKGTHLYPNVKESHQHNLQCYEKHPQEFFDNIIRFLNNPDVVYRYFRWHSAGDIKDMNYLEGMIRVAQSCPWTTFLAFTKQWEIVNEYCDLHGESSIPKNLRIVFSMWNDAYNKTVDNKYNFPMTAVKFKHASVNMNCMAPITDIYTCPGSCKTCKHCWEMGKHNVTVFHQH